MVNKKEKKKHKSNIKNNLPISNQIDPIQLIKIMLKTPPIPKKKSKCNK